jgi:hypothetical protein
MSVLNTKLPAMALACAVAVPVSAADHTLLNLLAPDARIVMGVDVDRSRNSPFGQYLLSRMQEAGHDFDRLAARTGFDPRRDLAEVVAGARNTGRRHGGVVVARGRFDVARIVDHARSHGAAVTTYQSVDILTGPNKKSGWFGFLDDTIAVGGEANEVRAAINRWRAGSRLDSVMAAKVTEVSSRNDAFVVMLGSPAMLAGRVPDNTASAAMKGDMIRAIEQMSGGIRFGTDVVISAEALTKCEKDAAALADVIRFLAGMAQLHGNPQVADTVAELIRRMELTTESNRVSFSLAIPEAQFEKLFRMFHRIPPRHRAASVRERRP